MALTAVTVLAATPAPALSATAATAAPMETATTTATAADIGTMLLTRLNTDRTAAGLTPLRSWPALATLATERAARMAATYTLSHAAAGGDIGDELKARGINWLGYGEVIANSGYPRGADAVARIYGMW